MLFHFCPDFDQRRRRRKGVKESFNVTVLDDLPQRPGEIYVIYPAEHDQFAVVRGFNVPVIQKPASQHGGDELRGAATGGGLRRQDPIDVKFVSYLY